MPERARVLDALARAGLGVAESAHSARTYAGMFALHPHQVEAVQRLQPLLHAHHGALLADTVGLGKTYVGLALASGYRSVDVIAPAGLVSMWRDVIARTQVQPQPEVRSLHAFSTARPPVRPHARDAPHLVIIDEAHHLRNPATRRYRAVADWCRRAHVLLLSATPVHNDLHDVQHLLALFLGTRAQSLDDAQRTRLIVRRTAQDLERTHETHGTLPTLIAHDPLLIGDSAAVTTALSRIPPPVPTRDGRAAGALITLGLVRAWCSSGAACLAMLGRRRARAQALSDILAQGRWPSQHELRAWTVTEDTVQLGFTELLVNANASSVPDATLEQARAQLAMHTEALSALAHVVRAAATPLDRTRVEAIRKVRAMHRGVAVIAFSQFADTVRGIGRLMQWDSGVATLTSHGGRVAGGTMPREELLRRAAPRAHGVAAPAAHERIYLVLTTDLLAEGVNLQDAGVVMHLDLPWTPAAIAQREGRIARLGSLHGTVHAYTLSSPGGGAALMRLAARLRRKARAVSIALAPESARRGSPSLVALPTAASPLHRTLRRWRAGFVDHTTSPVAPDAADGISRCAWHVVQHRRDGWLAVVGDPDCDAHRLYGGWFASGKGTTRATSDPRVLTQLVQAAHAAPDHNAPPDMLVERYHRSVERALHRRNRVALGHAFVESVLSPVHRAQRYARRLLASVSLADRLRLAAKASLALRAARTLRGAGDELALDRLLGETVTARDAEQWFDAVIALGDRAETRDGAPRPVQEPLVPAVHTLLLLVR